MNKKELDELAAYADEHDFSAEMKSGQWHGAREPDPDPMISTSLRLPKSLLDWVRAQADDAHTKPTALIRAWIEEKRNAPDSLDQRVQRLEEAVFRRSA
ncbi:MAG: hypothetical protein ACRDMV_07425 [Streptosporangiales bacterium]